MLYIFKMSLITMRFLKAKAFRVIILNFIPPYICVIVI